MNKCIKRKRLNGENYQNKPFITAARLYAVVGFIAIILIVIVVNSRNLEIYKYRAEPGYRIVNNIAKKQIKDKNAPVGIKQEYTWTLKDINKNANCLAFYVTHQYVEVSFDKKLMYSLNLNKKNKIGKTTANNWVIIPLMPEDEGKTVSVKITPAYKEVIRLKPIFLIGARYKIYARQLKLDFPQIILSLVCIMIGILFLIISIMHKYKGSESLNLVYLGSFSIIIGLWKITDIRFATMMFSKKPEVLCYTSIIMLLIAVIPIILSIKQQFSKKYSNLLEKFSIFYCIVILIILMLQIFNIRDLRQTLWIVHLMIDIIMLMVIFTIIYERKHKKISRKTHVLYTCLIICIVGVLIDMSIYYIKGNSAGVLYTLVAFLNYVVTMGYMSINDINQKANIDIHTGLFNKSRCNELLDQSGVTKNSVGIIMFDLNGLKHTNDTLGHEFGDILISEFANIISINASNRDFVGRYGGDEFIVVIQEANKEIIEDIDNRILQSVLHYNLKNRKIHMSYSMGYALASDYPGYTLRHLLEKADENMYKNKKAYYEKNNMSI